MVPLEAGIPEPLELGEELIAQKQTERKFLGQLVGSDQVDDFQLPVVINADLRVYQKQGVNWLVFLNRYGLHGILCDGKMLLMGRYGAWKDASKYLYDCIRPLFP